MTADKETLREQARLRRSALSERGTDYARVIATEAEPIAALTAGAVGGYWPLPHEADPRLLMGRLADLGRTVALPCVAGRDKPLVFRCWSAGDAMVKNRYGVEEPAAAAAVVVPSILLVPMLAFDAAGHRLGYGGGYYDRTLDRLRRDGEVIAIGVAFAGQELAALPRETHDHALDYIVTEQGLRTFG